MNKNITSKQFINTAHQYSKGKVCTTCKKHKLLSEFYNNRSSKDGLCHSCNSCKKVYSDNTCRFKKWFINKKGLCKQVGKEFTIEPTDIPGVKIRRLKVRGKSIWEATEYPKVCSKWDIELNWNMTGISQYNSPSLDRIDPRVGYIPGNVRLVCQSYNMAKCNCPPDEWDVIEKQIARSILGMTKPF